MSKFKDIYGVTWNGTPGKIDVEFNQIRRGKLALEKDGRSLFFHFRAAFSILWPKDDHNRWSDLILKTYCENEITVITGCSDSNKTWTMSKIVLVDYWCYPDRTLWLVSTTEGRGSELRFWGAIKDLFNMAKEAGHNLAGNPIDHLKTITTDSLDEEREFARSLRRGIIVVPCKTGSVESGLAPFIGIKAPRLRHAGDEVAVMASSFLDAYSNWFGKEDFKGMMSGNFMETDDPLGIAAEPEDGWDSWVDTGKTQTWRGKFYNAAVIALDGRDSPNFDFPDFPVRYPYMIGRKKLEGVRKTHGEDSWQWYSQCVGKPAKGTDIWRVLNKDFCRQHHALDDLIWDGPTKSLYAIDPAYGQLDRCVGRKLEFGKQLGGQEMLKIHQPEIIPISVRVAMDPEDQIAAFVYKRLEQLGIPAENCFYDSFGRGTLGFAFAKLFGLKCPVPVDSGAQPTGRPVRFDMFVPVNPALPDGAKRLKRCNEHYTKFITEMYFSFREVIDCDQMRGLDEPTMLEGCARKFTRNKDSKLEIEPKADMKERLGKSPDFMDCGAIGVEGARRLGFKIKRIGAAEAKTKSGPDWLDKKQSEYQEMMRSHQLQEH